MPKYQYTAQNEAGKRVKGERDAADEKDLYQRLRQESLFLLTSKEKKDTRTRQKIKTKDLADFCRELATLLAAGVSLVRALGIISEEENLKKNHRVIYADLQRLIRQGVALSDAMEQQGDAFPELMIHMFRSAEASGKLDQTAFRMANHYEKESKLKSKVSGAMVYPCILLCAGDDRVSDVAQRPAREELAADRYRLLRSRDGDHHDLPHLQGAAAAG